MSEHAKTLEPKIRALQEGLKKITSENNTEQLLLIIHSQVLQRHRKQSLSMRC
jgi:hypothetical protein